MGTERDSVRKTQRAILHQLVVAGKITQQQADSQARPEDIRSVIPDTLRLCKDDEAVAYAVAKAFQRKYFVEVEVGVSVLNGSSSDQWFVHGGVIYMTNMFDEHEYQKALAFARANDVHGAIVGVVSNSRIEQVKTYDSEDEDSALDSETQKIRAMQRIEDLIREAARMEATDIHLQPTQGDQIAVRYRIDGDLIAIKTYKKATHAAICRVLMETLCQQPLETSIAQDGKFEFNISTSKKITLRVSTMPVTRGAERELKIVLRLLGSNAALLNIDRLGLASCNRAKFRTFGDLPNGMIILTGPTGSGKTTTLTAQLLDMQGRNPNKNYHTIEDPVEFQHEGIGHTECGAQLSFAAGLRALLRQDPDVILVGEMRDDETADLSYKAAMTGHLVLSTLHTNNAHQSIRRLERMNIERDIIVTNTTAFIAQRLVKSLCQSCRIPYELRSDEKQMKLYGGHPAFSKNPGNTVIYRANPAGCPACKKNEGHSSRGLKGRRGVVEILEMTPEVQMSILDGESPTVLRRRQIREGSFQDLWDDGLRLVVEGLVGIDQLSAELKPFDEDRGFKRMDGMSMTRGGAGIGGALWPDGDWARSDGSSAVDDYLTKAKEMAEKL